MRTRGEIKYGVREPVCSLCSFPSQLFSLLTSLRTTMTSAALLTGGGHAAYSTVGAGYSLISCQTSRHYVLTISISSLLKSQVFCTQSLMYQITKTSNNLRIFFLITPRASRGKCCIKHYIVKQNSKLCIHSPH